MAERLFFVREIQGEEAELLGEEAHHLAHVLRVRIGDQLQLSDGQQLVVAEVAEVSKRRVKFRVLGHQPVPPPPARIDLVVSVFKFDRFEWMLEKAAELGVSHICPVLAAFTDTGLAQAARKRCERWGRILKEASQQCRRWQLPVLEPVQPLRQQLHRPGLPLVLDEKGGAALLSALGHWIPGQTLNLLVGPEGGWSEQERQDILQAGWKPVSLGRLILRAETAALAALATARQACDRFENFFES